MRTGCVLIVSALLVGAGSSARGSVVFQNGHDNGFFTPFSATTPGSWKYGDSGWFGFGSDAPVELESITLGLAVWSPAPVAAGTTDIVFSFHDGDPSGLVFGSAAALFTTTLTGVELPAAVSGGAEFFSITIPLAGVSTLGGFNNIGWSIQVQNFNYGGSFGFQCGSAISQTHGFYTNNASFFNGSSWSLFSFGPDPTFGVANYVATVRIPAPGTSAAIVAGGLLAGRRRRRPMGADRTGDHLPLNHR